MLVGVGSLAAAPRSDVPASIVAAIAAGLSNILPVAAGLSVGTGLLVGPERLAAAGPVLELPTTVGELDGATCAGVVSDDEGAVDVLDEVLLGDGLPGDEDVSLDDGLPDGDVLGVPDAVGEQLGVDDPGGPPPCWPAGTVPPPVLE